MSSNDVVLVQDMLTEHRRRVGNTLSDTEVDTYFAIESYLRHETLSRPEILEGVVDGSHDAGLDGAYLFIHGIYIRDDTPISALGKRAQIELILFQIKNTAGFGESVLHKPEQDIVSIDEMGQALLSACVQTPHIARGRVTRIFDNDVYKLLFHPSFPLPAYLACIRLLRSCTEYVRDLRGYTSSTDDFRFHLASGAAIVLTRKDKPSMVDMAKIVDVAPSRQLLDSMFELIQQAYGRTTRTTKILTLDQLAKDAATAESIIQAYRRHMRSTPREG